MECKHRKLLFYDADGTAVYVCCCELAPCFGKRPECDECGECMESDLDKEAVR